MHAGHQLVVGLAQAAGIELGGVDINKGDAVVAIEAAEPGNFAKAQRTATVVEDLDVEGVRCVATHETWGPVSVAAKVIRCRSWSQ